MPYATIADLRSQLGAAPRDERYAAKMLHQVPDAEVVDREGLILDLVKGKRVLEFGASGPLQAKVQAAARAYLGVDRQATPPAIVGFDCDDVTQGTLPTLPDVEAIVCGEVLEHLSNPGWFLTRLARQYPGVPVVITVPNAFSDAGTKSLSSSIEMVNKDHVSYYSYHTLKTLLTRAGYQVGAFCWYNGRPRFAEGLICVCDTVGTND